ncbi:MAG: cytochrome P450 [Myxococcota bacterium]
MTTPPTTTPGAIPHPAPPRRLTLVDAWRAGRASTAPVLPGGGVLGHVRAMRRERLAFQERLAAFAPVCRFMMGPVAVHAASDAASIQDILALHPEAFRKSRGLAVEGRPIFGDGLLTSDGQAHADARRLMAPAFTPRRLSGYGAAMAEEARATASGWPDGARVDLADAMMRMTLMIVGRTLFATDLRRDADLIARALTDGMQAIVEGVSSLVPLPYEVPIARHRRMRDAVAALDGVVYRVLSERRQAVLRLGEDDRGDVLSTLLAARDERGQPQAAAMSDAQVRDEIMTLMLAGHETTANALTWTLYALAREPALWDAVTAEVDAVLAGPAGAARRPVTPDDLPRMPLVAAAIDEALRLWPPAYAMGRQVAAPVSVGGFRLEPGTFVMINIYGLHRRPEIYPDPLRYDPSRMLPAAKKARPRGAWLPFGAGPRVCIGNHFALMEAQLALATILSHVRLELAAPGAPVVPEPMVTLRPKGGLPVIVRRRAGA